MDTAREAAIRMRLVLDGMTEPKADAWIAAWDAEAARDGLERGSAYWARGWEWIAAERERRPRP